METLNIKRYEEHTVVLIQGVDFEEKDLQPDRIFRGQLIPADTLTTLAKRNGFDEWSWSGNLETHADRKTVKVKFRKYI